MLATGARGKISETAISPKGLRKKTNLLSKINPELDPNDDGEVRLRVTATNAGPAPKIYYAEDGVVSETSAQLSDQCLPTKALRVAFLVKDPSGQYETGNPVLWANKLVLRNKLTTDDGERKVELLVAPCGEIRYTLDGSEPRNGTVYQAPSLYRDSEIRIQVSAHAAGLETKKEFTFPAKNEKGIVIDPVKPGKLRPRTQFASFVPRNRTFEGLKIAGDKGGEFHKCQSQHWPGSPDDRDHHRRNTS